ncbi:unnamed protein product [Prorocentrum cordatum]|uniref:Uncharacterized protein n=1 Tax=Prorocentrum cordatum TaxID=2364126 RepID=A0ABN9XCQ7_9DINO|nr:unnamed protein product [Polarella glacialis]
MGGGLQTFRGRQRSAHLQSCRAQRSRRPSSLDMGPHGPRGRRRTQEERGRGGGKEGGGTDDEQDDRGTRRQRTAQVGTPRSAGRHIARAAGQDGMASRSDFLRHL